MLMFELMVVLVAAVFISSIPGAGSSRCPSSTVSVNVTSTADIQTLSDVLACTGEGAFYVMWYLSLTISQRVEISNSKNVTVTGVDFPSIRGALGDDNGSSATIDAENGAGIFSVANGSILYLNHLLLEGGIAQHGGAVSLSSSSLVVSGCTFAGNNASSGGAIYASSSAVYLDGNTSFDDNSANFGGAIYAVESYVNINGNAWFSHNKAEGATTEVVEGVSSSTTVPFGKVVSSSSSSKKSKGGAIYADASTIYISGDASFAYNSADYLGGAAYVGGSDVYIDGKNYFGYNSAEGATSLSYFTKAASASSSSSSGNYTSPIARGGAMYLNNSDVVISGDATFSHNTAAYGGGIYTESSAFGMDGSTTFHDNSASTGGGGIYAESSAIDMGGNTSVYNNSAGSDGATYTPPDVQATIAAITIMTGSMYVDVSSVSMHGHTEFDNNQAGFRGGVIHTYGSTVHLDDNTDFFNSVSAKGGAFSADSSEIVIDGNTRFIGNTAGDGGSIECHFSNVSLRGTTVFSNNSAGEYGGAMLIVESDVVIDGSTLFTENSVTGDGDGLYFNTGDDLTSIWNVVFIDNFADGLGGAMCCEESGLIHVSGVTFTSNEASLGGAVYTVTVADEQTEISECVFERNEAADGGAVYLNTGPEVDTITLSHFLDNSAQSSGGAIVHTGSLRVLNSTFMGNEAGVEGTAITSLGFLETLSNVSFSENTYYCGAGKYGYIVQNEAEFCTECFDEVCARCSVIGEGVAIRTNVRSGGLPVCAEPPTGATARTSGTTVASLTLDEGYYRTSIQSHDVLECYQEEACQGGNDANNYCADGYQGPYCAVCAEGYAPGIAYSCRECSSGVKWSAVGLTVVAGLAVVLLGALLLSRLGGVVNDEAEEDAEETGQSLWRRKKSSCGISLMKMLPLTAIKIVVTVWQIISQFDAIAGDVYPELYKTFISKLNPFNLDLDFALSYSCLVTYDFYDRLLFATIAPFIVLAVLAASYFTRKSMQGASEASTRAMRHSHQGALLYVAFIVYSPVSYKIFRTFACDELDDGEVYLRADYSLSCLTARHSWYKVYSLVMVGVYPIGMAAVFALWLFWHRRDLAKPERGEMVHLTPLSGMWAPYRPSRYYFEVVECCRRIAFTGIAAFVLPNSTAQISLVLLFALAFVFFTETLSPFAKGVDMGLYRWGNGIVVASMYVAFLMKIDVGQDTEYALLTFSGVIIAANVFMVFAVLFQTWLLVKEWRRVKKAANLAGLSVGRTR